MIFALFKNGVFIEKIYGTSDWDATTLIIANESLKSRVELDSSYEGCEIKEVDNE